MTAKKNLTKTSSTDATSTEGTIVSSATYQNSGNHIASTTDSRGNTTSYTYDATKGLQTGVTDAKGNTTGYTYYDNNDRLKSVTSGNSSVTYLYEDFGGLNKITAPSGTVYNFTYDAFWNTKTISVGTQKLIENFYNEKNGPLDYAIYGNGAKIGYHYDTLDRVTEKLYNDVVKVRFRYDRSGNLYEKQDLFTGTNFLYDHDFTGRLLSITGSDGSSIHYTYDAFNRISKLITETSGNRDKTEYIYGDPATAGQKTGLIYSIKQNDIQKLGYAYDALGRMQSRTLNTATPFVTEYSYLEGAAANTTTTLVKTVKNGSDTLEYAYDKVGNITSITKNGVLYESYTYDSLSQLKTVTRGENTWGYTYDNGGNLLSVKLNGTEIKTYGYADTNWKDKLTSYNGQELTYDEIGNPLTYRDGMGFTWQNGRQLASVSITHSDGTSDSISYSYNADGIRTSKTVNDVTTEYYILEGVLLGQKTGDESIFFLYDENGSAYGFLLKNGTTEASYYYEFNLQGDVTGIIDASGTKVVEYTYGAWRDILSVTGTMAGTIGQKNPLRYRGYYYDVETGFYYLNSRYYDPEIGRWINADNQIASIGGNIKGYNLFSYCFNNPINMSDPSGGWPQWMKNVGNAIVGAAKAVVNFFSPNTHTVSGQFQDGIFRGSGSVTGGYSDIMARGQGDKKVLPSSKEPSVTVGAFAKVSIVNATGKVGIGNDNVALSAKGVGDVLTASAQAGLKYQDGLGLTAKAKAAVVSGRATLELSVLGWQVEFGVTGDALSAGAEATIGIFDGAFEAKANASLGVGGGFILRIKPPQ